jgi:hypothetical protein
MLNTQELWSVGNLYKTFKAYGLSRDREKCAALAGVKVATDEALRELSTGIVFAEIGSLEKAREWISRAVANDPTVFEHAPGPEECWLFCARAFAETDPERAIAAFGRATSINPGIARRVDPTWRLAELVQPRG